MTFAPRIVAFHKLDESDGYFFDSLPQLALLTHHPPSVRPKQDEQTSPSSGRAEAALARSTSCSTVD
jgi:hypothetical protein